MLRTVLTLILFSLCINIYSQEINQTDSQGRKQGFWQKRSATGKLVYEGTFKDDRPVGEMKRYHPGGVLKASMIYTTGSDTSSATLYDEKGKLAAKGKYIEQKRVGEWSYYADGRMVSSEVYENDLKSGVAKTYYQTGELLEQSNWKNNFQDGLYTAYEKSGKKYLECMYQQGKREGWSVSFYPSGEMETEVFYKNNLPHGDCKHYDEQGKSDYTLKYENGKLTNPEVLDSIQNIEFNLNDKNKTQIADPEKFIQNPEQYLIKAREQK